ncbi:F-box protein At4g19940-like [Punica granatum]|uniref:F-box protein At4g19940-like n=1 Tax=Punica granatum TaxID=22663 RepID=A0A6P8BUU9_PUNGR|nr:F-box protein At4g19940-like [Punica granatum]
MLTEILARLRAKSLLRFRSVSRSWDSLLTSPLFIALHLSRSIATRSSSFILLRHYCLNRRRDIKHCLPRRPRMSRQEQDLDFPIRTYDFYYYISACNGLLCLTDYRIKHPKIVLWNPSDQNLLSGAHLSSEDAHRRLRVWERSKTRSHPVVEVFVLGTDRWREVDIDVPYVVPETSLAVIHGTIHWIGYRLDNNSVIITVFDVHEEVFREIKIPSSIIYPSMD